MYSIKKTLMLLAFIIFITSCSNDDNGVECGKIISTGWNNIDGDYIKIEGHNETIPVPNNDNYQLGETYCL